LENSFRESPLLALIKARQFWVFTPITFDKWDLLHEDDWPEVARPGVIIGMSFVDPKPLKLEAIGSDNLDSAYDHQKDSDNPSLQQGGMHKSLNCRK
jgi:hypothetical protein